MIPTRCFKCRNLILLPTAGNMIEFAATTCNSAGQRVYIRKTKTVCNECQRSILLPTDTDTGSTQRPDKLTAWRDHASKTANGITYRKL